jgi:hypothetical protein
MDYPHPIAVLKDGKIDLSKAYDDKIGELDKVMVAYGYQHFPAGTDEAKALNDIIQNSLKAGLTFFVRPGCAACWWGTPLRAFMG